MKHCHLCGHRYHYRNRYLLWPITVRRTRLPVIRQLVGFARLHIGNDGPQVRAWRWHLRFYNIIISFGHRPHDWRPKLRYVIDYGWLPREQAELVELQRQREMWDEGPIGKEIDHD